MIFIKTDKNVADMFIKPLPNEKFEEHEWISWYSFYN